MRRSRGVRGLVEAARTDRTLVERLFHENCALRRENDRLARYRRLACVDALTGLSNRRGFDERLSAELSRAARAEAPLTLVYVDLDDFKILNDGAGHLAGDRALEWMGRFLEDTIRTSDVACRIGGDEFALILPDTDREGAELTIDRLRETLAAHPATPVLPDGRPLSISLGCATFPYDGVTATSLLARADLRMFDDKANKRAA